MYWLLLCLPSLAILRKTNIATSPFPLSHSRVAFTCLHTQNMQQWAIAFKIEKWVYADSKHDSVFISFVQRQTAYLRYEMLVHGNHCLLKDWKHCDTGKGFEFSLSHTYEMLLKLNCRQRMWLHGQHCEANEIPWTTILQGIAVRQCHCRSWGQEKRCNCWRNLCSRSLLVRHSDSATVTAAILLSDVGTSQRSDKSETDVINRCDVRNLPQIHWCDCSSLLWQLILLLMLVVVWWHQTNNDSCHEFGSSSDNNVMQK